MASKLKKILTSPKTKSTVLTSVLYIGADLMCTGGLGSTATVAIAALNPEGTKRIIDALFKSLPAIILDSFKTNEKKKDAKRNHTNAEVFAEAIENCLELTFDNLSVLLNKYGDNKSFRSVKKNKDIEKSIQEDIIKPIIELLADPDFVKELFRKNEQVTPQNFIADKIRDLFNGRSIGRFDNKKNLVIEVCTKMFNENLVEQMGIVIAGNPQYLASYHTFLLHQLLKLNKDNHKELKVSIHELHEMILLKVFDIRGDIESIKNELSSDLKESFEEILKDGNEKILKNQEKFKQFIQSNSLPRISYQYKQKNSNNKFFLPFNNRYTEFIGRLEDKAIIRNWIDDDKPFDWMMIEGSAGTGKSRLAQEICDEYLIKGWRVGFYKEKGSSTEWGILSHNLLLVIDYVSLREDEIIDLLESAANDFQLKGDCKLRILILDRAFTDDWKSQLRTAEIINQVNKEPHPLPSLRVENTIELIRQVAKKVGKDLQEDDLSSAYSLLKRIDKKERTLIAILIGKYFGESEDLSTGLDWTSIKQPIHDFIFGKHGEIKRWKKHLGDKNYNLWEENEELADNILFIMAFVQESTDVKLCNFINDSWQEKLSKPTLRNFFYLKRNETLIKGLQPDLIAEYYIVNHIERSTIATKKLTLLFDHYPGEMADMIVKIEQNFSDHNGYHVIQEWMKDYSSSSKNNQYFFDLLSSILYNQIAKSNGLEGYEFYLPILKDYFEKSDKQLANAIDLAKHLYNIVYYSVSGGDEVDIKEAEEKWYKAITDLRNENEAFENNPEIALEQARAALNIGHYYSGSGGDKRGIKVAIEKWYKAITDLRNENDAFENNPAIALEQARAAYNIGRYYSVSGGDKRGIKVAIEKWYKAITDLRNENDAFKNNPEIAFLQALAAVNIGVYYSVSGGDKRDIKEAEEKWYKAITDLRNENDAFKNNPEIALRQARTAVNIGHYYSVSGGDEVDIKEAEEKWYKAITDLRNENDAFKNNPEIAFLQANAAFNIGHYYSVSGGDKRDIKEAEEKWYKAITDLRNENDAFENNLEIALEQAGAALNIGHYLVSGGDKRDIKEAEEKWYKAITDLRNENDAFKNNPEIALRQARAAVNIGHYYSVSGGDKRDIKEAEEKWYKAIMDLRNENDAFKNNPEIALEQTSAAVNIGHYYSVSGGDKRDIKKAEEKWYKAITDLRNENDAFKNNPEIAFLQALAAFNIGHYYSASGGDKVDIKEAEEKWYKAITDLRNENDAFENNPEIALRQAGAALNIGQYYSVSGGDKMDIKKAEEKWYKAITDLRNENDAFKNNPEIATEQIRLNRNILTYWSSKEKVKDQEIYRCADAIISVWDDHLPYHDELVLGIIVCLNEVLELISDEKIEPDKDFLENARLIMFSASVERYLVNFPEDTEYIKKVQSAVMDLLQKCD